MTKTQPICTIIGFTGRSGADKDTCAEIITQIDKNFKQFAFADALKTEVSNSFRVDKLWLFNRSLKEQKNYNFAFHRSDNNEFIERMRGLGFDLYEPRSPREVMQLWGNEYRRHQDEAYWVNLGIDTIHGMIAGGVKGIVISDVRFINEAETLKTCGAQLVRIYRHKADNTPAVHESETVDKLERYIDHSIHNPENNFDELVRIVEHLFSEIQRHEIQTN